MYINGTLTIKYKILQSHMILLKHYISYKFILSNFLIPKYYEFLRKPRGQNAPCVV